MHSVMMISYYDQEIMIDCGEDWLGHIQELSPQAIVITHGHPDHAWGLQDGAPCPVYATEVTWKMLDGYEIERRVVVEPREAFHIAGFTFEAFPVEHSTVAPAVGYRVTAGAVTIFYVPDVVYIPDRAPALKGAKLYIGDGATITRSMVRKPGQELVGHTPIRTQLTWCQKEGVPRAIFTHCGSQIVKGDERTLAAKIRALAGERDVEVQIAHDGMEMVLR